MEEFFILLILSALVIFLTIYLFVRVEKFDDTDPKLYDIMAKLRQIDSAAAAKIKLSRGKKSYTINKQVVYLCLYDKNGDYYDDNTLMYVSLHELAHVKNKEIGHTNSFHKIFNEYLEKAQAMHFYDRTKDIPDNYCII
jgi:beta-lactamase regulating signal transducer with metallopeptidase domain